MKRSRWRAARLAAFAGSYLLWLLRANYEVAREILTPGSGLTPAVVDVPLRSQTPGEIASFTGLITLTPGTMALALNDDRTRLTVHGMHAGEPEAFRASLQEMEDRMLAAWRPNPSHRKPLDSSPPEVN